jgi:16S rRNA (cytidine1402-2'-O)-methyltransferase
MTTQSIWLVPAPLSQQNPSMHLGQDNLSTVHQLHTWLVETPKTARSILKLYQHPCAIADLQIISMADFSSESAIEKFLHGAAHDVGILSDAGCPAIADPGANIVQVAHKLGWNVCPMVGASSIVLGLMASGLSGQRFAFHGYPPKEEQARALWIASTENSSKRFKQTQVAIETPYRNQVFFDALCRNLKPETRLCVASELTGFNQNIKTQLVKDWIKNPIKLDKIASLFLWLA